MVKELTREILWESGTQFGHQSKKWNPKMKPYIYGKKNNIHIIDLQQTIWRLEDVKKLMVVIAAKKGKILFVGTKKQAKLIIKDVAERTENFYVNQRWLGGTLTNFKTIQLRIKRLWNIEYKEKNGFFKLLSKKEQILIYKEKEKLKKLLWGIKEMRELPQALFIVDPKEEHIAVSEARKLKIPIIAICDTNVDPDGIDYVIPGNDDTVRSIAIITNNVADLYGDAMGMKLSEPQFKTQEIKKEEVSFQRDEYLNNKYGDKKISQKITAKYENFKSNTLTEEKIEKLSVKEKYDIKKEKKVLTKLNIKTMASLKNIIIIENDLEKSFSKLKNNELEIICSEFNLTKGKKKDMINSLIPLLTIKDNTIVKK